MKAKHKPSRVIIKNYINKITNLIPLKRDIVAGVTVLTLGSGGSSFLIQNLPDKAGLLSIMATFKCFVKGMLAANTQEYHYRLKSFSAIKVSRTV